MPSERLRLDALAEPIVQAPMAGGPSTPALAAAVSDAGGLGFLAAGRRSPDALRADIAALRQLTDAPFGVNLFVPGADDADPTELAAYAAALSGEQERQGVAAGSAHHDDDGWEEKLALLLEARVAAVSFTFGAPPASVVQRLQAVGSAVLVTVTEVDEAHAAELVGPDALVVQGVEAGGHRGSFSDEDGRGELGLLVLLRLVVRAGIALPLVAAGGIADGSAVAAALTAGASAAQLGTAFLRTAEAGTSAAHREALAAPGTTGLTRAFSGRRARGIVNRFQREHRGHAPSAYPHVAHLTGPLQAAAAARGDADAVSLWAGQAFPLAEELPAGWLTRRLGADARAALAATAQRVTP
ncbi:MAG: 2-nitropropane dioxygenase [Conexibacter sp.]|nr:2-nitropropane dioxygenase [Conexibacter sp.]